MTDYGFTGTRQGMTAAQKAALAHLIMIDDLANLHHGDCVGADAEAHGIVLGEWKDVTIHPPIERVARAFCELPKPVGNYQGSEILAARPYLERNHNIVKACEVLIAAPISLHETMRSGTWATVRYARAMRRPIIILDPAR